MRICFTPWYRISAYLTKGIFYQVYQKKRMRYFSLGKVFLLTKNALSKKCSKMKQKNKGADISNPK